VKIKDKDIERIAKLIDPDGTFLDECEEVVKERWKKKKQLGAKKE